MKLNTNLVIGSALVLGGGYYAYKKGWFGKKQETPSEAVKQNQETLDKIAEQQAAAAKKASVAASATKAIAAATTIINANSYKGKVAYIQNDLGVAVDGIAGPQTNMAYNAKYGLDKGNISESNIDYYKNKVVSGLTLVKQGTLAKQTSGVAIVNALKNGGSIRFIKSVNAQNFVLNKATNSYAATGTNLLFNSGAVLSSSWRAVDRGAGLVLIYKQGATTLQQVPVNAIVVI